MKPYFFGYLFVRFAKLAAILVLLAGVGGVVARYWQGSLAAESLRYEPSRALESNLAALEREMDRARSILSSFIRNPPPRAEMPAPAAPSSGGDFAALQGQFAAIGSELSDTKDALVRQFDDSVGAIESKLRAHAAGLSDPTPPPPGPKPSAQPPPRISISLYSNLDPQDLARRRDIIAQSRDMLAVLRSGSENPENAKTLGAAVAELRRLETLLPASLDAPDPPAPPPDGAPAPAPKLNAERVAEQLEAIRGIVRAALTSEWAADNALEKAASLAESERAECLEAERALARLWLDTGSSIFWRLLAAVVASFLILVLADVIRALLDSAVSSEVIAATCRNDETV